MNRRSNKTSMNGNALELIMQDVMEGMSHYTQAICTEQKASARSKVKLPEATVIQFPATGKNQSANTG